LTRRNDDAQSSRNGLDRGGQLLKELPVAEELEARWRAQSHLARLKVLDPGMRQVLSSIGARDPAQELDLAHGGDNANIQPSVVQARSRRHLHSSAVGDAVSDRNEDDVSGIL